MRFGIVLLLLITVRVFGQSAADNKLLVNAIRINGNEKTRRAIILREMEFKQGDTLSLHKLSSLIDKSRSNLLNTELFNFVKLDKTIRKGKVDVVVNVTEQWYSWVFPIFEIADRNFNAWWRKMDFNRADYGLLFIQENFRGRAEYIHFKAITGYNEYLEFRYAIPYIDKKKRFGLELNTEISRRHETRVSTFEDEVSFFKSENRYPFKKYHGEIILSYRPEINNVHSFSVAYDDYSFHDTLLSINPDYLHTSQSETNFITLKYKWVSDYRDYISYPLQGHYIDFSLIKNGLGLIENDINFWQIKGELAKYWHLGKRFHFASSVSGMLSEEKNQPYFLNKGLGYTDQYVRSYEYKVINGNAYGLARANIKYTLIPTQTLTMDFIPLKQFSEVFFALYLNAFVDAGYVDGFDNWKSNGNKLPGNFLLGKGIGLDLVTYYEKVLRLEYSWNKQNQGGLFIHFRAPI